MEWELQFPLSKKARFAVECKYRSRYQANTVEICKTYQLENYRAYELNHKVPVYILLGIGGGPSLPDELFVIPLKSMRNNWMSKTEVAPFKKTNTDDTFFYDSNMNHLS
jgi:hypothetical protein